MIAGSRISWSSLNDVFAANVMLASSVTLVSVADPEANSSEGRCNIGDDIVLVANQKMTP